MGLLSFRIDRNQTQQCKSQPWQSQNGYSGQRVVQLDISVLERQCGAGKRHSLDLLADFANRIGVNQSYLSAVEHGRNEVEMEVLLVISREFSRSLEQLLTGGE
jgi:transcriptional regulator with XRE-family HTH domain